MTSPPSSELAVQTVGLGKRFGARAALDGVDLDVPRGVAFGFLGANGAGKTTLIRLLLGLAVPTAGSMRVLGRDVARERAAALSRVGAIIEEPRQSVDLSAFRIVQEALTNVVKHAGRAPTRVTVGYRPDTLELTIYDSGDPEGTAPPRTAGGHGLIGMRERAALFGGTLSAGPCNGHGYEVRASLPYGKAVP
jgi:glucose-6-phosphate-specific signal transduction histidine kinase